MGFSGELLPFTAENANVLGPKVRLFGWNLELLDPCGTGWLRFGEEEEAWIHELGKYAIARKATLKTVETVFRPGEWQTEWRGDYPWGRMDNVRDTLLRPNGMDLVYSTPFITTEQWVKGEELLYTGRPIESDSDVEPWGVTPPGVHRGDIRDYFSLPYNTGSQ
jgi:hypothetical protein